MRFSRLGIFVLIIFTVIVGANCTYYDRVIARKNLVDGSKAYKDRQFQQAEELFRDAVERYPEGQEGKTAQLFLARTLHSEYIGNRGDTGKAQEAIAVYQQVVPWALADFAEAKAAYEANPTSEEAQRRYLSALNAIDSTVGAISNLYENTGQPEKAAEWQNQVSNSPEFPAGTRARTLSSAAAKMNTCANDITDTEATKKTVTKDGKQVFQYVKPEAPEELEKLRQCVDQGLKLSEQAVQLESGIVPDLMNLDVKSASVERLRLARELLKPFESVRSYRASLLVQAMRLAEMEGRTADQERLKAEAEQAREEFLKLGEKAKEIQAELDARAAAAAGQEAAANAANAAAQ